MFYNSCMFHSWVFLRFNISLIDSFFSLVFKPWHSLFHLIHLIGEAFHRSFSISLSFHFKTYFSLAFLFYFFIEFYIHILDYFLYFIQLFVFSVFIPEFMHVFFESLTIFIIVVRISVLTFIEWLFGSEFAVTYWTVDQLSGT